MSMPFSAVSAAYGNAAKLGGNAASLGQGAATGGVDFGKMLSESVQGLVDSGKQADKMAMDMVNGKADVVDVVTAISQTEIAMETMVTVRDRVISAYEEIMRMPI